MAARWILAPDLAVLRDAGELILFNPAWVDPVYAPEDGDELLEIVGRLRQAGEFEGHPDSAACPADAAEFLAAHAVLVRANQPRPAPLLFPDPAEPLPRVNLFLLLARTCNQACAYCFNGRETYGGAEPGLMAPDLAGRAAAQALDRVAEGGVLNLVFFGGEPLLNWPAAQAALALAEAELRPLRPDVTLKYSLTSNLAVLPRGFVSAARRYRLNILVNVDGPPEVHDALRPLRGGGKSFSRTAENIRRLAEAGVAVDARATITARNVDLLPEVARLHRDLGAQSTALLPLNAVDSDARILPRELWPDPGAYARGLLDAFCAGLFPEKEFFPFSGFAARLTPGHRQACGCEAPFGSDPAVSTGGRVFACNYLVNAPEFAVGEVDRGFQRPADLARIRDAVLAAAREDCASCLWRSLCGGGCPVHELAARRNPQVGGEAVAYGRAMNCALAKTVLTELIWRRCRERAAKEEGGAP